MTTIDRNALGNVLAVINGKGGVGKTTLTANIGGLLAKSGYRVLLVDLDPQGNLAEDLGYTGDDRDDQGKALAQALMFGGGVEPLRNVRENLDVFAGGLQLDKATAALAAQANKDPRSAKLAVAAMLEPIAGDYDLILIDCPPGDEMLQTAAVAAARWALVPVKTDKSSRKGLTAVAARLDAVLDVNPTLDLLGVVIFDTGTTAVAIQKGAREEIARIFNADTDVVLDATVRHSEKTAQVARELGMLVHEVEIGSANAPKWYEIRGGRATATLTSATATSVADDLQALTSEVVQRMAASLEAAE